MFPSVPDQLGRIKTCGGRRAEKQMGSIQEKLKAAAELTKSWEAIAKVLLPSAGSAAAVPLLARLIFPALNPKIIDDLFWSTMIVALVVGAISYIASLPQSNQPVVRWPIILFLPLCVVCWIALLALTGTEMAESPFLAYLLARVFFIGFFVGLAGSLGWIAARLLNERDATA
jgi:hypothetical protein